VTKPETGCCDLGLKAFMSLWRVALIGGGFWALGMTAFVRMGICEDDAIGNGPPQL